MPNRYGYCRVCGKWAKLEPHHVYGGCYRKKSEKYGMVALICRECHDKIHFSKDSARLMKGLRSYYQTIFEQRYPNLNFREIFGRNWKDEDIKREEGIDIKDMKIDGHD